MVDPTAMAMMVGVEIWLLDADVTHKPLKMEVSLLMVIGLQSFEGTKV